MNKPPGIEKPKAKAPLRTARDTNERVFNAIEANPNIMSPDLIEATGLSVSSVYRATGWLIKKLRITQRKVQKPGVTGNGCMTSSFIVV